ncbi:MAG: nuclear transport factor 2 family protein [Nevskia sp.]|uniref:nuclear transport factor 2 family protein n=1 Tax=Nevskia sp. TaxID=1929292 RepID=UPI00403593C3
MHDHHPIHRWHQMVAARDPRGLDTLLADDAVFHSPVVHTPQRGKAITALYLRAAFEVFFVGEFRYVREIIGSHDAMLEFETTMDGVAVNGVDLIRWNDAGQITDFKVMVRPLKGIQAVHQRMGEMLARMKPPAA